MRASWARRLAAARDAPPVEMRFIDLFMAALGAVIFLAMLLAFLLGLMPGDVGTTLKPEPPEAATVAVEPLTIATRSLPQGRVGAAYELTFAHRGGEGPIRWAMAGEASQLPSGIRFEPREGRLRGNPSRPAQTQLLLTVVDAVGHRAEACLDLIILPDSSGQTSKGAWFAVLAAVLGLLFWLGNRGGYSLLNRKLTALEQAYEAGHLAVAFRRGPYEEETVRLPAGLGIYRRRLGAARRLDRLLLTVGFLLGLWWTWHLWRMW